MSAVAGKTTAGKVWHVAVSAPNPGRPEDVRNFPLCGRPLADNGLQPPFRPLATVPAYRLCQHCERAVEQIAAAVREVQS